MIEQTRGFALRGEQPEILAWPMTNALRGQDSTVSYFVGAKEPSSEVKL